MFVEERKTRPLVGQLRRTKGVGRLLQSLEVLHRLHAELQRGVVVADDHGVLVHLQAGNRPHVVHALLHALGQSERLVGAVDDDDHLASVQDSADTYGQRRLGHLVDVVVEETAVRHNSVVRLR